MVKRFNVVAARKYTGKDGNEKTQWLNVGTVTRFDNGNQILELNFLPNEQFPIFEQKPKENKSTESVIPSEPGDLNF